MSGMLAIMSPSARKVWIEICGHTGTIELFGKSPSVRKVWIEINL